MRIEIDLPDWVIESRAAVRIFAGIELVAKKESPDSPWLVKTARCNFCGECCILPNASWPENLFIGNPQEGICEARIEKDDEPGKFLCMLGHSRPFMCCAYSTSPEDSDICSIRWEEV